LGTGKKCLKAMTILLLLEGKDISNGRCSEHKRPIARLGAHIRNWDKFEFNIISDTINSRVFRIIRRIYNDKLP